MNNTASSTSAALIILKNILLFFMNNPTNGIAISGLNMHKFIFHVVNGCSEKNTKNVTKSPIRVYVKNIVPL